jgi:2-iminobutanoate/2-iminopropanoate deaminase
MEQEVKFYSSSSGYPFSDAVRVGHILYLAGHIGTAFGRLVPGGIGPETEQTLKNIEAVLNKCGASIDDVFDVNVMLTDINDWPAMNTAYQKFFKRHFPARSAYAVKDLVMGACVEITCKAVVR